MKNSELKQFFENNPDRYEIFHYAYRAGLKQGFAEALRRTCGVMEMRFLNVKNHNG